METKELRGEEDAEEGSSGEQAQASDAQAGGVRPRGRMSAYAFFVQACREEHKEKHPDENVVFAEFASKCAERWKNMSDQEKQHFYERAEKDKKRYEEEMANYKPPKKVCREDPNAPKRALSAFFWFCNDERPKIRAAMPNAAVGEIARELGRKWNECSQEARDKYEALAAKDRVRYDEEYQAYYEEEEGTSEEDDDDEDAVPIEKPCGRMSAYAFFVQSCREEYKKRGEEVPMFQEFSKECGSRWKEMSVEEKTPFTELAMKDKERYDEEMAKYKAAIEADQDC